MRHNGEIRKPSLDLRVGEGRIDLSIEVADDLTRCVLGRAQAEP